MSDNAEQLVYQVSVDLGSSMNKVTDLRKGFEDAKKSIESVNSQEVHNIVDPAESSRVLTLSQRLAEVKKALDLISQGYSLKVGTNDIDNAEAKLRSLEKLYGDMQRSTKDGMLSNVSDQAARQNRRVNKGFKSVKPVMGHCKTEGSCCVKQKYTYGRNSA